MIKHCYIYKAIDKVSDFVDSFFVFLYMNHLTSLSLYEHNSGGVNIEINMRDTCITYCYNDQSITI